MTSRLKKALKRLPEAPGVYLFRNSADLIIYVGKASCLRSRVKSYFSSHRDFRSKRIGEATFDVEVIPVSSEGEALILEASLIKRYQPLFNVDLKDDKSYPWVKLTSDQFPAVRMVRESPEPDAEYFGPFTDVECVRNVLKFVRKFYPLRTCKTLPVGKKRRPCTAFYMNLCLAPCAGMVSLERYARAVEGFRAFFSGQYQSYRRSLRSDLKKAVEAWNFEEARILSQRISLLEKMEERIPWRKEEKLLAYRQENVLPKLAELFNLDTIPVTVEGYDISNLGETFAVGSKVSFRGGVPWKAGYRRFRIKSVVGINDYAMLYEVIYRRIQKHEKDPLPDFILIDGAAGQLRAARNAMEDAGKNFPSVALAKKEELIFFDPDSEPLRLSADSPVLRFLQRVRDESHRFARTYHRSLRSAHAGKVFFENIPGIGEKRREIARRIFAEQGFSNFPEEALRRAGIPAVVCARMKEAFEEMKRISLHKNLEKPFVKITKTQKLTE
ncbi:MAG: excinuclease ABC subunit UvrC [Candidatus Ratteibacteria bacterium]|jgi:excinuclease ABC subunit C